ncbi:hypothetical protein SAMN04487928_1504 [Butyrivibrio proteoclasticus]|uniref:Uncharacterized protein n=1 Tax=Butyrivibrio proteoclasticus TaxID=43305 RepID=A0A1I5YM29_9FIRM|nr:hypothetical protein [Butyrivibrio proteoclasticus]SFQ45212.1 hypothetical protein SAMN04487928_1504 [Butyrivibrio proteoclasticus]
MIGWETEIRGNTERNVKRLYDMNDNHVGTISISRPRKTSSSGKKKKTALYSFKQVSSQVLQAKTSTKAMQVSNSIRAKIGLLKKQLKNGDVAEETVELDEELDEMAQALSGSMTSEDLEQLKVKHRSDEARDILKADLKYLKALFDRLQSEKENAGKANFTGAYDSGVSLSLGGGMDMPVMTTQEVQQPDIGGSMDIEV